MSAWEYTDGKTIFEGHLALPKDMKSKRPCVLVAHAWDGPNSHFNGLAEALSRKGFVGFAIDVYGKGNRGKVDGDNGHLMNPLLQDRALLQRRLLAAFNEARRSQFVLPNQIAILGFCFGGLCALDLARSSPAGLRGAISVHGLLIGSNQIPAKKVEASILVLHGWEDPMVNSGSLLEFTEEMNRVRADWQVHCYGHAKHAFTFVGADLPSLGIKYDKRAHIRSEAAIEGFLKEIFD